MALSSAFSRRGRRFFSGINHRSRADVAETFQTLSTRAHACARHDVAGHTSREHLPRSNLGRRRALAKVFAAVGRSPRTLRGLRPTLRRAARAQGSPLRPSASRGPVRVGGRRRAAAGMIQGRAKPRGDAPEFARTVGAGDRGASHNGWHYAFASHAPLSGAPPRPPMPARSGAVSAPQRAVSGVPCGLVHKVLWPLGAARQ